MRRSFFPVLVILLSLISGLSGTAQTTENTLLDVIQSRPSLSVFAELIDSADVNHLFTQTDRPRTVFAPSNSAFADIPAPVMAYLSAHPQLVERLVRYHLVADKRPAAALVGSSLATLEGASLTLFVDDSGVSVDGVPLIETDTAARNGILHTLDHLLLPPLTLPAVDPLEITGDIRIAGSSTVYPLTERIREAFYAGGYTDDILIQSIGTGGGFERFCVSGETDISNASRAIRQAERDLCQARGRVPLRFTVGMDALAVVVSAENTFVENLSLDELAHVFSGATTWADVNPAWPNEPVERYIPGTDSGTFDYVVATVFDGNADPLLTASNRHLSEDDTVLVEGIAGNPYAIGFFGYAYYRANQDILTSVAVNGVAPTEESAERGTYRLARPLYLYSAPSVMQQTPHVAAFINYYLSSVNDIVQEAGYFPTSHRLLNLSRLFWLAATETPPQ